MLDMKVPSEIRTYCPFCKHHTLHAVKLQSKGRSRSMAWGNRQHEAILKGHGGKRAGKVPVKKQAKRWVLVLTCKECGKKHQRVMPKSRTRKKPEVV